MAIPPSVMLLIDNPASRTPTTAASSDSGIASSVMAPARRFARKHQGDENDQQRAVAQRAVQVRQRQLDEVRLPEQARVELHAPPAAPSGSRRAPRRDRQSAPAC